MNASFNAVRPGLPAVAVIQLSPRASNRRAEHPEVQSESAGPRPIAALLPQVLSQYGLAIQEPQPQQIDLLA